MLKGSASDFEMQMYIELRDRTVYPSRYEFLKGHNGIRPNSLTGLMSSTGAGKTTLLKCIIAETALHGAKVLLWLSEETIVEYQELLYFIDKSCLKNIVFIEETEIDEQYKDTQENFFAYFEQMVEESGADIVFIDNVTTSNFYSQVYGIAGQAKTATFLRSFTKRVCEVFYIAHTKSEITENYSKVINSEDIRGSKELPHRTEYLYIIQKFTSNGKQYNCLRVAKYRHHEKAEGWFSLAYENRTYIGDAKVPFNLINKIFSSRDYFGKRVKAKKPDSIDLKKDKKK
ncbi:MAG: hypothetical protein IMF01_09505 [Proteobacteria bacterium]|nr:hypothetical protein [Pseudomonadota bacterium]